MVVRPSRISEGRHWVGVALTRRGLAVDRNPARGAHVSLLPVVSFQPVIGALNGARPTGAGDPKVGAPRLVASAALVIVALLAVLASGLLASPTIGQETEDEDEVTQGVLETGIGVLQLGTRRVPLGYTTTLRGDLVDLAQVVRLLGGELIVGPLQQSHTLKLFGDDIIIGPESKVMTVGEEIIPLQREPLMRIGGLQVPVDFLEKAYAERAGFRFYWSRSDKFLEIERREGRVLPVELDHVTIAGVSHLVLLFDEEPYYRVSERDDGLDIIFPGDRLDPRGKLPRNDPLIRSVRAAGDRVSVALSPNAEAAAPYRVDRGNRIQVVIDIARRRAAAASAGPAPRDALRDLVNDDGVYKIVLDPGHGGEESGAVGPAGTLEKDLTLLVARTLKRRLENRLPVRVILTRDTDVVIDHDSRSAIANQNRADLFVSIHFNSAPRGQSIRGAETYFLDREASDELAARRAEFENRMSPVPEDEAVDPLDLPASDETDDVLGLQLMLWDLAQTGHLTESQRLARLVQQSLNEELDLRDRGVKQAPFRVLMGAAMPAVLVELGFLSNPDEEQRLLDASYRLRLVDAVVDAIGRFRLGQLRSAGDDAVSEQISGARP